jgi:tripartite-type tricarboxylate transporter receptor subunit TctC
MKKILLVAAGLLAMSSAHADGIADFYRGKTIRMVVGVGPGSAFDLNARAVAKYLPKYLPGSPTVIVQNQPGAASLTMANTLANVGPFDGTAIGASFGGITTASLFSPAQTRFDPQKLAWIGTTNQETNVGYVWKTAPVQKFADVFTTQLLVGAQAPGTMQYDFPTIMNAMMGTKYKVISGYEGTPQIHAAMERGEVQGVASTGYVTLKLLNSQWIKDGTVKIIIQWGVKKNPDLPDVPLVTEFAKTDEQRQALDLMFVRLTIARPFFMPPGTPPERVQAVRRAFDAVMKDKDFIDDETKLKLDVIPMTGEDVSAMIAEAYKAPPEVSARLRQLLGTK